MTSRRSLTLVIFGGLTACSSGPSDATTLPARLTGRDFIQAVADERVGLLTGLLHCEASHQGRERAVFHVGLRPLAQRMFEFVDRQPQRAQQELRSLVFTIEVDSSWINREPAAADLAEVAPFDGDYWRITVLAHRDEAVGFVRGYRDCIAADTARFGIATDLEAESIVDSISKWYGLDRATGDVDSASAAIPVREFIERAVVQRRK